MRKILFISLYCNIFHRAFCSRPQIERPHFADDAMGNKENIRRGHANNQKGNTPHPQNNVAKNNQEIKINREKNNRNFRVADADNKIKNKGKEIVDAHFDHKSNVASTSYDGNSRLDVPPPGDKKGIAKINRDKTHVEAKKPTGDGKNKDAEKNNFRSYETNEKRTNVILKPVQIIKLERPRLINKECDGRQRVLSTFVTKLWDYLASVHHLRKRAREEVYRKTKIMAIENVRHHKKQYENELNQLRIKIRELEDRYKIIVRRSDKKRSDDKKNLEQAIQFVNFRMGRIVSKLRSVGTESNIEAEQKDIEMKHGMWDLIRKQGRDIYEYMISNGYPNDQTVEMFKKGENPILNNADEKAKMAIIEKGSEICKQILRKWNQAHMLGDSYVAGTGVVQLVYCKDKVLPKLHAGDCGISKENILLKLFFGPRLPHVKYYFVAILDYNPNKFRYKVMDTLEERKGVLIFNHG